jgi:hypothetical protein
VGVCNKIFDIQKLVLPFDDVFGKKGILPTLLRALYISMP